MKIIRDLVIGKQYWLGDTCYEVLGLARDEKNKVIPGTFDLKPVDWSDLIKNAPEEIQTLAKKTLTIRTKVPLKVME